MACWVCGLVDVLAWHRGEGEPSRIDMPITIKQREDGGK
jgi:hypothetical protein